MAVYFDLAHGTKPLANAGNFPWPYIAVCFELVPHPIAFSEGVGHGAAGCVVSAAEALEEKWKEHFDITGADWLIPYIELLAQGIPFQKTDILLAFERIHGRRPTSYESRVW